MSKLKLVWDEEIEGNHGCLFIDANGDTFAPHPDYYHDPRDTEDMDDMIEATLLWESIDPKTVEIEIER